jgi:hypothetical protein
MRWSSGHYHLTARFDSDYSHNAQFRDQPFFTLAMSGFLDVRWRAGETRKDGKIEEVGR